MAKTPNKRTVRDAVRASVPEGKLREAKIELRKVAQGKADIGGFTEYDRAKGGKVVKIGAPAGDDAFSVSIRGHETRHATRHKPSRKKPMSANEAIASQIVDDVNVECSPLPNRVRGLRAYERAHMAVAMRDIRTVVNKARAVREGRMPDSIETRNGNLLASLRSMAMLQHYGARLETGAAWRGGNKARAVIGERMHEALQRVIFLAKSRRKRATAISMLVGLMEEPEPDFPDEEGEKGHGDEPVFMPPEGGSALEGHMSIVDLRPKSVYCAREKHVSRRYAPNGVIINPTRYISAVTTGDATGLFSRRVRHKPGGTVIIDASGSMGVCKENLLALCQLIPTATVAYYSGRDGRGTGMLCIYSYKGKRFADTLPDKTLLGGNAVDLPAVRWMFGQPKPWTLVSDLSFCGGVLGSEEVALALVERSVRRGELTVHRSLDAAYEHFGGKGPMLK